MRKGHAEYMRAWRKKNAERHQAIEAKALATYRATVDPLKAKPCMDCGGSFPPECMDWDHVRGKKLFGVGSGVRRSIKAVLIEIAKCELVCSNCHRIRTRKRRES